MAMIAFPLVNRKLLDWRDVLNAGIIDEHIQATECFLRKRDHLLDLLRLAHVRGRIDSLHAEILLDCRPLFLGIGRRIDAVQHDVGPAPAKERAHARPMPLVEPLTTAVLPLRIPISFSSLSLTESLETAFR